jgi:hypothetical protein
MEHYDGTRVRIFQSPSLGELRAQRTMQVNLLVVYGKTTKRKVAPHLPAVLGRSRGADITVGHPLISRRHCELFEQNGLLMLRDLASLNGTMIGGKRIEMAPLLPGAQFAIGPLAFQVLYEYHGDVESVPEIHYREEAQGAAQAHFGTEPISSEAEAPFAVPSAWSSGPAEPAPGDFGMPDVMALADAEIDQVLPAVPPMPAPQQAPRPVGQRPAVSAGMPSQFQMPPMQYPSPRSGEIMPPGGQYPMPSAGQQMPSHGQHPQYPLPQGGPAQAVPWPAQAQGTPTPLSPTGAEEKPSPTPADKDDDAFFGNFLEGLR